MAGARARTINWRRSTWFSCIRYALCPNERLWEEERELCLREAHVEIGSYPVPNEPACPNVGMTSAYIGPGHQRRLLVTLADSLDDDLPLLFGVLAHECFHVTRALTEAMCDESPSEEFLAHVVGAMTEELARDLAVAGRLVPGGRRGR